MYTWGCNDDGAVGRDGDEAVPMLVPDIRYVCGVCVCVCVCMDCGSVFDPGLASGWMRPS